VVEVPVVEPTVVEVPVVEPTVVEVPVVEPPAVVVLPPLPTAVNEQPVEDTNPTTGGFLESEINPTVPANPDTPAAAPTAIQTQPPIAVSVPVASAAAGGGGATGPAMLLLWLLIVLCRSVRSFPSLVSSISSFTCVDKRQRH